MAVNVIKNGNKNGNTKIGFDTPLVHKYQLTNALVN